MKKHQRIALKKDRVAHHENCVGVCHICGDWALHTVFGFTPDGSERDNKLYLCTDHLTQIFRLPSSRQPKKARPERKVAALSEERRFTLRCFMDAPLTFDGVRMVCHSRDIGHSRWYFALYLSYDAKTTVIVSISRVSLTHKNLAINLVGITDGLLIGHIGQQVVKLVRTQDGLMPFDSTNGESILIQLAATEFIEKCEPQARRALLGEAVAPSHCY